MSPTQTATTLSAAQKSAKTPPADFVEYLVRPRFWPQRGGARTALRKQKRMLGAQAANGNWEGFTAVFALVVLVLALTLVRMRNR